MSPLTEFVLEKIKKDAILTKRATIFKKDIQKVDMIHKNLFRRR